MKRTANPALFKTEALNVFNARFKALGHKFNPDAVVMEYEDTHSVMIEYYDAQCLLCKYKAVMSIVDGTVDAFRIDDDKGLIAHKSASLTNEYRICPRLSIME